MVINSITFKEFGGLSGILTDTSNHKAKGRAPTPQTAAIRAMELGEALILSHDNLAHQASGCSMLRIATRIGKRNGYKYSLKHLDDGTVAVACRESN